MDKKKPRKGDFNPYIQRKKRSNNKKTNNFLPLLLIIIPFIICLILFIKVNSLQKQVDMLMIDKYGMTYSEMGKGKDSIVHVSNTNKQEDSKEESDADIEPSIEETKDSKQEEIETQTSDPSEETQESTDETTGQAEDPSQEDTEVPTDETQANEETEQANQDQQRKKVYLTFDDGPSKNTPKVLDILKEYNIKATFFVIGKTDNFSLEMYNRIIDEGHTIGLHSYTHDYDYIYGSLDNFKSDLFKLRDLIYDTTGYMPDIYRFPGGSANRVGKLDVSVFIDFLEKNNITYYDWNVINGDATGQKLTEEEAFNYTIDGVKKFNVSQVLMHDSSNKDVTVESLPKIIEALIEKDVEFLPLSNEVKPVQQVKVDEIMSR